MERNESVGTAPLSAEIRVAGQTQQKKGGGGKPPAIDVGLTIASILADRDARITRAQRQMLEPEKVEEVVVPEEAVDAFVDVESEITRIEGEIADIRGDENFSARSTSSMVNTRQAELNALQAKREVIIKAYPTVAKLATKKVGPQTEVRDLLKALNALAGGRRVRGEDVGATVVRWSEAGILVDQEGGPLSWRIGREEHAYGCAWPENAVIMGGFAALVTFVTGWKRDAEVRAEKAAEPVSEFLIKQGELDALKQQAVRIIPFLTGNEPGGNVCVLFVVYGDDKLGEVVFEHVGDRLVARKVARTFAAMKLFGVYGPDPKNPRGDRRVWRRRGHIEVPFPKLVEAGNGTTPPKFDLSGIVSPELRYAIEAKIASDWDYQVQGSWTQAFFGKIEDISSIDVAKLVTSEELRHGRCKPGDIAVVRIAWETRGSDKRLHGRVDLLALPDKRSFQVINVVPEDLTEKVDWIARFTSPALFHELDTPVWLAARRQGAKFERDVFATIAAKRFSATLLSKDNVEAFAGLEGGDGTYVISHEFRGSRARHSTPVLYVVKKQDGKVTIVWALPGVSERSVRDDIGQSYEVEDLPRTIRGAVRNQLKFFKGWGGQEGMAKVREHYPHLLTEVAEADDAPGDEEKDHEERGGEQ